MIDKKITEKKRLLHYRRLYKKNGDLQERQMYKTLILNQLTTFEFTRKKIIYKKMWEAIILLFCWNLTLTVHIMRLDDKIKHLMKKINMHLQSDSILLQLFHRIVEMAKKEAEAQEADSDDEEDERLCG